MALISLFILSRLISSGLYSTKAVRPGKFTVARFTPSNELSFFSTLAEQAEQAMPTTGIVRFSIVC